MRNYEQSPITADIRLTYEIYRQYFVFSSFKGRYYKFHQRLFYFISFVVVFFCLFFIKCNEISSLFLIIIIAVILLMNFYLWWKPKQYYKNSPLIFENPTKYSFKSHAMHIEQIGKLYCGSSQIDYAMIYRIYETDKMFYIYIAPRQAYLICKDALVDGSYEDLRHLLQANIEMKKYYICY